MKIFEEPVIECIRITSEDTTTGEGAEGGLLKPSMDLVPDPFG